MTLGQTVICAGSDVPKDKLAASIAAGGTGSDVRSPAASANTRQHGAASREAGGPPQDRPHLP